MTTTSWTSSICTFECVVCSARGGERDRLIAQTHREGRSQEAIGVELDVPRQTVSNVLEPISQIGQVSRMANS